MKIISWNVNGIRACMKKGLVDYVNNVDADFFHMQEIKITEEDLEKLLPELQEKLSEKYNMYYNCATKRKGYSGVLTLAKHIPKKVVLGLPQHESNNEGRLLTLMYKDFYMLNSYFPNTGRDLERLDFKIDYNEKYLDFIKTLEKPSLTFGDFNVAHTPQDIARPKQNEQNAGYTEKERNFFTRLLSNDYIDTFRYMNPDTIKYSWWAQMYHARDRNVGWRIDYGVISKSICKLIKQAEIQTEIFGSDHCPISLDIDL